MQHNNSWQSTAQHDTFSPGQAVVPSSNIELSIRGKDLADMDIFSKSDPFCVLYIKDVKTGGWICVDRTETIDNTLDPEWEKKFILQYKFEERQVLKFEVYDADDKSSNLDNHDFIGAVEISLGEIVSSGGRGLSRHLIGRLNNEQQYNINPLTQSISID